MKKVTTIMLFSLFSLMLLSWCWNKKENPNTIQKEIEENIIENQISEEDTTWIEIAEKLKVPELTESDLKYFDKEKFNESQQDYENELDMFLSDWKIEEENKEEIIKEDTNTEEVKEENKEETKQEKTNKTKEKTTTSTKENNVEKKTNETTTNKNQQTKNKNVSTKNKTTIKEQLELQKEENKESKCKKRWWTYNKSQDFCYQIIELE